MSNLSTALQAYANGRTSFLTNLLPSEAVQLDDQQILPILAQRLGVGTLQTALSLQGRVDSPLANHTDSNWLKRVNMVGINVRTIQSFWNVVKYALTLPASQSSIHLLPIWEPGVVSSLYGMASWQINPEFYSAELAHLVPQLDTVEKQLKAVVNLLHAMGKTVGMDVIPHTDRYSEMALAQPQYFEWLVRRGMTITDHRADLHIAVQQAIWEWLRHQGPATMDAYPKTVEDFFAADCPEATRLRVLFGEPTAHGKRQYRRAALVDWLYRRGMEPVPATMAPPYRGLEVDPNPSAKVVDYAGREWRDYRITEPQEMSRVFGPLARYKFYERLDDNRDWAVDFARPRTEVWDYFCQHYAAIQEAYNFDFMRGDMSHVQMRAAGVPMEVPPYYDPLGAVKEYVQQTVPYFGYFAESFLAPDDVMGYGNEVEHLVASSADTTLGDLQSMVVGEKLFLTEFQRYLQIPAEHSVVPNFTIMTADKDDPRFDKFYLHGNEARLFLGLFLTDTPSYMGLGFEQRDPHPTPVSNEYYTKLYVFHLEEGPKATHGPYVWGENTTLFEHLHQIRLFAEEHLPALADTTTKWLLPPNPETPHQVVAWTQADQPTLLFIVNLNGHTAAESVTLPPLAVDQLVLSVVQTGDVSWRQYNKLVVERIDPGACLVFSVGEILR